MIKNFILLLAIIAVSLFTYQELDRKNMSIHDVIDEAKIFFDPEIQKAQQQKTIKEKYKNAEELTDEMMRTGDFTKFERLLNQENND